MQSSVNELTLFLISYPAEREQILDAVAGFFEGKNGFSIEVAASTPIPVKDLPGKIHIRSNQQGFDGHRNWQVTPYKPQLLDKAIINQC
jgi:hypothetical protein